MTEINKKNTEKARHFRPNVTAKGQKFGPAGSPVVEAESQAISQAIPVSLHAPICGRPESQPSQP